MPIRPAAGASIILLYNSNQILLQLRDDTPTIQYPGHWSLFSGMSLQDEPLPMTAYRELHEELVRLDGRPIRHGPMLYLMCDKRTNRPWSDFVFYTDIFEDINDLLLLEGKKIGLFSIDESIHVANLAPHHKRYINAFLNHRNSSGVTSVIMDTNNIRGEYIMPTIDEFIQVTQLKDVKDYSILINGDGFVVSSDDSLIASINTHCDAAYIALLEFLPAKPRGNHYHRTKVEYMVVLRGTLQADIFLPNDPSMHRTLHLKSGQMLRILPGCGHTYTALGSKVIALEFTPQPYDPDDTLEAPAV